MMINDQNLLADNGILNARPKPGYKHALKRYKKHFMQRATETHQQTPYIKALPLPAILIILFLTFLNLLIWGICALVLVKHPHLLSTAALAYSLGLRHALDADHISAIDLMTRRLVASGDQPVTVGTFFSLGHSTIVVITSIVVAATAAGISKRFDGFSNIGGIIGSSVSATFLILLGIMNAYILFKLLGQLKKVIHLQAEQEMDEGLKFEGGGIMFRILKRMFKLIDRPWKMYPLGILFGLGFDTSSEVALLGISSLQGAKGTSIWLILIFPVLFTVGMCLIDTIDGALMMSLYVAPFKATDKKKEVPESISQVMPNNTNNNNDNDDKHNTTSLLSSACTPVSQPESHPEPQSQNLRLKSPLPFLYYSTLLTFLTVLVALIIGTIQLLTLILNAAIPANVASTLPFWQGVQKAGDNYDIIGGGICAMFVLVGGVGVLCYGTFRRWVGRVRERERLSVGMGMELDARVGGRLRRNRLDDEEHGEASVLGEIKGGSVTATAVKVTTIEG